MKMHTNRLVWKLSTALKQKDPALYKRFSPYRAVNKPILCYKTDQLILKNRASYIQDGRTATLQMLHFTYFFSTNISTEYFKHAAHSPFFFSKRSFFHNATFFGSCIIHILHTGCSKI